MLMELQELLGHCTQVYQSNRQGFQELQGHLMQYGYHGPATARQPADPVNLAASGVSVCARTCAYLSINARRVFIRAILPGVRA